MAKDCDLTTEASVTQSHGELLLMQPLGICLVVKGSQKLKCYFSTKSEIFYFKLKKKHTGLVFKEHILSTKNM